MRSATVLDRQLASPDASEVHDLLVLWQHPQTREIVPIGRFTNDGANFAFSYTRAAATIEGFRPLPGFADLHHRYISDRLPPVFGLRVMGSERPDFNEYINSLGLDPERASPWEQIVHSGGQRAGDTLQFMQVPTVTGSHARARFLANGVRHIPETTRVVNGRSITVTSDQHEEALRSLSPGAQILVAAEIGNGLDTCACLVTSAGVPLGYVPRVLSTSIRRLMSAAPVTLTVVRVGAPQTPSHLRLVLDLDVRVSPGFQFDPEGLWEPLSD